MILTAYQFKNRPVIYYFITGEPLYNYRDISFKTILGIKVS